MKFTNEAVIVKHFRVVKTLTRI